MANNINAANVNIFPDIFHLDLAAVEVAMVATTNFAKTKNYVGFSP